MYSKRIFHLDQSQLSPMLAISDLVKVCWSVLVWPLRVFGVEVHSFSTFLVLSSVPVTIIALP